MKRFILLLISIMISGVILAQVKPYDETIDAVNQIQQAIKKAANENKYVLCQVGGNWCPWCLKFAEMAITNRDIKQVIDSNYVYIHVNWSKNNKNPKAMALLENPTRFGFPVFVILDSNGKRIHTQSSAYLEDGNGYSEKKVVEFLKNWTPKAVNTIIR